MNKAIGWICFAAYIGCVFGANWALQKWGIVSVGFGLTAGAGVWFVGLSFTFRDFVQDELGRVLVWAAILIGGAASYWIAPSFALASLCAFLLSEALDFMVYTPLRSRDWGTAVLASNIVGAIVDSVVFLWIAFGWASVQQFWFDQTVAKVYMALPFVAAIWVYKRWRGRDLPVGSD